MTDFIVPRKTFHEYISDTYIYKKIFFCVCEWIFSDQYTDASAGFTGSVHSAGMAEKGNRLQPPDPEHLHENRIIKIKEKDLSLSVAGLVKV